MSEALKFHFPIATLSRDGDAIITAAEKHTELAARLPADNVTEARGLIGQVTAGIAGQKGKAADVGTLTAEQNKNLQTLRTWMSRARQTATLAFPGQTVKLHEEFQVGVSTPTDLASILSRADIILAAVKKADNLAALKLKGWLDADTAAFEMARGKLGTSDVTQEAAKSGAKDATGSRNHTANDLYDHLMTIQNAADLQWPADNPANGGMRDEFRLSTFPPRGGSNGGTTPPAPPKTPTP
jgi:hypothetical protein